MAYSEIVMQHYSNPSNVGTLDKTKSNVGSALVGAPSCGDVMRLQIEVKDGVIVDTKFKTFGCGSAIAASSLATEWIKGKTLEEAEALRNSELATYLKLPPVKIHCSVLAEEAIKGAIADYKVKTQKSEIVDHLVKVDMSQSSCSYTSDSYVDYDSKSNSEKQLSQNKQQIDEQQANKLETEEYNGKQQLVLSKTQEPPIQFTQSALEQLNRIIKRFNDKKSIDKPHAIGVRIGVRSGGCAGLKYAFDCVSERYEGDIEIQLTQESSEMLYSRWVFIPPKSLLYIVGTTLDYQKNEDFSEGFVFLNPNAKGACGCGESFYI